MLSKYNKDADQIARMSRLICVFVVRISHKTGFLVFLATIFITMYFFGGIRTIFIFSLEKKDDYISN